MREHKCKEKMRTETFISTKTARCLIRKGLLKFVPIEFEIYVTKMYEQNMPYLKHSSQQKLQDA